MVIDRYAPQSSFGRVRHDDDADKHLPMCGVLPLVRFSMAVYLAWHVLRKSQDRLEAHVFMCHVTFVSIIRKHEAADQPRFFCMWFVSKLSPTGANVSDTQ